MRLRTWTLLLLIAVNGSAPAADQTPWRVHDAMQMADWLTLSIQHRTRFESLHNQFRAGSSGGDQVLAFRTNVLFEARRESLRVGGEFVDARIALDDSGTPVNTTQVNELEWLQAYVAWRTEKILGADVMADFKAGRQTLDFGSRRLISRSSFRNTINNFTGMDLALTGAGGSVLRGFFVLPVTRLPSAVAEINDHDVEFDEENSRIFFTGLFYGSPRLMPGAISEFYVYYLNEDDTAKTATRNRELVTPGIRIFRSPAKSDYDFEVEAALQFGTSRASTSPSDLTDLDHSAFLVHGQVGYSFDAPWNPRLVVQYDYASGDDEPADDDNENFDSLFGARRFEFGPTGIWGPFARSNISTPGYRAMFSPAPLLKALIAHRFYWLADSSAAWSTAGLQDPGGASGKYLGHQIEARLGWDAVPGLVNLETGWAHFFKGEFAKNAPSAPDSGDSDYFYLQTTLSF